MARDFDGTDQHLEASDANYFTPGTGATWSAWIRPDVVNIEAAVIAKWAQSVEDEYMFGVWSDALVFLAWHTTGGDSFGTTAYNIQFSSGTISASAWSHIAVVRSTTDLLFYINGPLDVTRSGAVDSNAFRNGTTSVKIGGQVTGANRYFNGRIDQPAIWNAALNANEILALSRGCLPRNIRRSDIITYPPIFGLHDPEIDYGPNNASYAVNGTTDPPKANGAPVRPSTNIQAATEPAIVAASGNRRRRVLMTAGS